MNIIDENSNCDSMKIRNSKKKSVRGAVHKIVNADAKKHKNNGSYIDLNQRESAARRNTDPEKLQTSFRMEPNKKESFQSQTSHGRRRLVNRNTTQE